jgi:Spy/CpxP family protein refolding chaperone
MLSKTPGQSFLQNLYNFVFKQQTIFTTVSYHKPKTGKNSPEKPQSLNWRYIMNSKLRKKIGTGVVVLLITVCFIPAMAGAFAAGDGKHGKGFDRKGHHRPALGIWRDLLMVQKLELTTEQVKQVREADFTFREKHLALKAQLDSLRLQMEKAFTDDVVDDTAVLSLAEKISDVKGKMFIQKIEARLEVGKLLNADQIKKLKLYDMHPKKQRRESGKKQIYDNRSIEKHGGKKCFEN